MVNQSKNLIIEVLHREYTWKYWRNWTSSLDIISEWQGYGNTQGYRAGVCRGRGKGMMFETPRKPLPLWGYGGYKYLIFLLIYCMNLNKFVIYTVSFQPTCDFPMFSKNQKNWENFISRVRKKWGTGDSQINWNGTVYIYGIIMDQSFYYFWPTTQCSKFIHQL